MKYKLSYGIIKENNKFRYGGEAMKKHPYQNTGDKIKEVRGIIPGFTQKKLAAEVGCTTDYIAMLERGEKPLTEGMAYKIARACNVLPEYLLLLSDKPNVGAAIDIQAEHNISNMWNAFIDYISREAGYTIDRVNDADIPEDLKARIVCEFKNDAYSVPVSSGTISSYFDDITEYAVFKLNQMLKKERSHNG